ncbi:MAG: NAD-binding protein [Campylobacterales bacterium]|nr:NAD-binding protein [Campylobacterales bacterium]
MKDLIIKFAYMLEGSKRYYKVKHFFYELLEDNNSKKRKYFDFLMIFLVLSTVAIPIYEVNHAMLPWLDTYETFAIVVFIIEWVSRLWVSSHARLVIIEDYEKSQLLSKEFELGKSLNKILKDKLAFVFSPMSIIDLLAILPYYRPLRILRILMLFRLFKILRYTNSIKQFRHVFIEKRFEFFTLAIMFMMAVVFGSTVIFIYEGAGVNPNIHNYFDAVYWSVITISTVGFGDISPVTVQGRVATLFLVIGGMAVIAFFTSIVTTALSEKLAVLKQEKMIGEVNSLKEFVIICGFGRMGKVLAEEFVKVKQKFVIIDINDSNFSYTQNQNFLMIKGDATDSALLESIGINNGASTIVAITDSDSVNLSIILTARSLSPNINIIARANKEDTKKKLILAGANQVVLSNEITALVAAEYIGQPVAFEAIDDILLNNEGATMDEIEILGNSNYIGFKLQDIDFSKYNLTLIGIIDANDRKNFVFNPKKDQYVLKEKDILIVIGYKEAIIEFKVDLLSTKPKIFDKIKKRIKNAK